MNAFCRGKDRLIFPESCSSIGPLHVNQPPKNMQKRPDSHPVGRASSVFTSRPDGRRRCNRCDVTQASFRKTAHDCWPMTGGAVWSGNTVNAHVGRCGRQIQGSRLSIYGPKSERPEAGMGWLIVKHRS